MLKTTSKPSQKQPETQAEIKTEFKMQPTCHITYTKNFFTTQRRVYLTDHTYLE